VEGFGSTELDHLIATTQSGNLDLAAAEARVLQADARVRQSGAALLPTVSLSGDATKIKNGGSFRAGLGASYELDFWGKNRDILNAARAASKATNADRETVALDRHGRNGDDLFSAAFAAAAPVHRAAESRNRTGGADDHRSARA
jgi:outer membrane protein TolC